MPLANQNGIIRSFVASKKTYLLLKRALDVFCSALIIVLVLSWLMPILAILIKLDSKGPILFKQKRVGLNGKIFTCVKLRTMVANEDADERPAGNYDSRITRSGRVLRSTNLDELP